jgi:hypothetical protein
MPVYYAIRSKEPESLENVSLPSSSEISERSFSSVSDMECSEIRFEMIFNHADLKKEFKHYLTLEFSLENFLVWKFQ